MNIRIYICLIGLLFTGAESWGQLFPTVQRKAEILQQPASIQIQRLYRLNSSYEELNLNISPDGKYLFFMSKRGGQPWTGYPRTRRDGTKEYDGDIWYSKKVGGIWQSPIALSGKINTYDGEDEPNISPDGQNVYFQSWINWERRYGPYYQASLNGAQWGTPKPLGGGIHLFFRDKVTQFQGTYATDGMTISPDGKTFIVAAGADYYGDMDLYISKKDAYGKWSYLKRLSVSTAENERSPFIAADGKTIYFASDGYKGLGGLDIFKGTLNSNGTVTNIVNVGKPFNTSQNDYSFIVTADGREAYFVRNGDIHYANITNSPEKMKPQATLIVSGMVTDKNTQKPLGASVVFKNATGVVVATAKSNSVTGEFSVVINKVESKFYQSVKKNQYKNFATTLNITYNNAGRNSITANAQLEKEDQTPVLTQAEQQKKLEEEKRKQEQLKKQQLEKERKAILQQEGAASVYEENPKLRKQK